jgi:SpoVK/Ycf46/Vps4 family AAA+-type ATPase
VETIWPEARFGHLIAASETEAQLREICARVSLREIVRRDWTVGSVHARHTGVTALFAGPSGTGKTLAAEVIAHELGYDMFRIDLSAIVSKYIGETEKNLDHVFDAAENANAVLFFDEADALFGKRSEVKDAHDRYANVEIAYLLQKMEQFDGLAILATNLKQNLDEAFARRLTFCVNFAFPEATERRRLWQALWPEQAARADDVDLEWFAQEYPLSGGNIRNTVVAAIHLAAANGQIVSREHLLHATRREYQKLGKNISLPNAVAHRRAS